MSNDYDTTEDPIQRTGTYNVGRHFKTRDEVGEEDGESRTCEVFTCTNKTRHGKPWCIDHLDQDENIRSLMDR